MIAYYKTAELDGTTREGRWSVGETVTHSTSKLVEWGKPWTYLSLATDPAATIFGPKAPCRLFRVEPDIDMQSTRWPSLVATLSARVVEELDAWQVLGPNGRQVAAFMARLGDLSAFTVSAPSDVIDTWNHVGEETWGSARYGAKLTVWDAVIDAVPGAGQRSVVITATALIVRDLIDEATFKSLAGPVVDVLGEPEEWPVPSWCVRHA